MMHLISEYEFTPENTDDTKKNSKK
jgi:hypothetical protein